MSEKTIASQEYDRPTPELATELARVKERFIEAFGTTPELVKADMVNAYFETNGLYISPTITIPQDEDSYATARAIALDTTYPLPFVYDKFTKDKALAAPGTGGLSFAVPTYDLSFVSDNSNVLVPSWGEEVTAQLLTSFYAHELAHCVFHKQSKLKIEHDSSGSVSSISEYYPLSGMNSAKFGPEAGSEVVPMWAEEAFAVYVSAQATKPMLSDGPGHAVYFEEMGEDDFYVKEHYVVRSPEFPDSPGIIGGAVAGETLEMLDEKIPGTIDKMFQIARGQYDPQKFRSELQAQLPPELYDLMFTNQPYTTWTGIYWDVAKL